MHSLIKTATVYTATHSKGQQHIFNRHSEKTWSTRMWATVQMSQQETVKSEAVSQDLQLSVTL